MQKITPFLWFTDQAEDAAEFYTSLFPNSHVDHVQRYGEVGPGEPGKVMTVNFTLDGQQFIALNGGPEFKFNEAFSMYVDCADQAEVDRLWDALVKGGEPSQCGWLKDRYGLSWQIIPRALTAALSDPDQERSQRAMKAMLGMQKIDSDAIKAAFEGTEVPA